MNERRPALQRAKDADRHPTLPKREKSDLRRRKGLSTSDTLRDPRGEKLVTLEIEVPKALRKQLRAEAKRRGVTVSELVIAIMQSASRG
jgi:hypothetical protein